MGCLVVLLALIAPRMAIILIWLFSDWLSRSFDSPLWPVLGFLFLPYTTLAYVGAMMAAGSVTGLWLVLLIVAVLVDLGHAGGVGRYRRRWR